MINSRIEINQGWTLHLAPRSDAFAQAAVADGHNTWRNENTSSARPILPEEIPATVPGCIHTDLISAGIIDDISVDGREQDQLWIWKSDSTYKTKISQRADKRNHHLIFHGLDTVGDIYVNGVHKMHVKNMHRSYRLDITQELQNGDVELEIRFTAPLSDAEAHVEKLGLYPRPYDMPYNYQRKMACSYGWDWGPVTITSGIWKKVELQSWEHGYLGDFTAIGSVQAGVPTLEGQISAITEISEITLRYRVESSDGKTKLFESNDLPAAKNEKISLSLPDAKIWQPRGRGDQPLYLVTVELRNASGEIVDSATKRVGFRSVEIDTSATTGDRHMFAIVVNGERLWIRGANWIPDDPFLTRVTPARYQQRIRDMLEVNINGIRVWGGGIYESEDFYNFCDEEGIVVWQDFLFACAAYPETDEMFDEVAKEVAENVRRLSAHPSLVIYCGGNECLEGFQYWGWKEPLAGRSWGESFYLKTIPNTLHSIDRTRPYIPGSPFSSHSDDVRSFDSGTNHIWDVWNERGYERYEEYSPAFAAEFGFNGPGSWASLTKAIRKETLDSTDPDLAVHQKAFDGMSKVAAGLNREFANPPTKGISWYFAAALSQARAVEIGLKHFRSLYESCSGTILWQFNDMWPVISWAVLDYTGFRKLAWHAMKAAYRPRTICVGRVDQGAQLTILNDTNESWDCVVDVDLLDVTGKVVNMKTLSLNIPSYGVSRTPMVDHFPEIRSGEYEGFILARSPEFRAGRRSTLKPAVAAPEHACEIKTNWVGATLEVTVTAKSYLHELSVLPEVAGFGTNSETQLVYLLPGESHTFKINGPKDVLANVEGRIQELVWSHNRVVNQ
jgi:beta-mannosidase